MLVYMRKKDVSSYKRDGDLDFGYTVNCTFLLAGYVFRFGDWEFGTCPRLPAYVTKRFYWVSGFWIKFVRSTGYGSGILAHAFPG